MGTTGNSSGLGVKAYSVVLVTDKIQLIPTLAVNIEKSYNDYGDNEDEPEITGAFISLDWLVWEFQFPIGIAFLKRQA